jgi:hypothetical protein
MSRDDRGELRRIAEALFRALDDIGPDGLPAAIDLTSCDALTPETDGEHLVLQGKLCAQRLYTLGAARGSEYDQDAVIVMASTLDLVVGAITRRQRADSDELRRLGESLVRLQSLTMELDRIYATGGDA